MSRDSSTKKSMIPKPSNNDSPAVDQRSVHTDALATLGTIIDAHQQRDAIHLAVYPCRAGQGLTRGEHVYLDDKTGEAWSCPWHADDNPGDVLPRSVGIVDPFIPNLVMAGEWFWLIVYPRQITSLRHVWEHPSFPASGETGAAGAELLQATSAASGGLTSIQIVRRMQPPLADASVKARGLYRGAYCADEKQHQARLLIQDPMAIAYEGLRTEALKLDVELDELLTRSRAFLQNKTFWSEDDKFGAVGLSRDYWTHYEVYHGESIPDEKRYSFLSCSC